MLGEPAGDSFGSDPRKTVEENQPAIEKYRSWGAAKYGKTWND